MENTMRDNIMELVDEICAMPCTNCRGLNKAGIARKWLDFAEIPNNAEIHEIPVDWDRQTLILFTVPNNCNYYSLFAGLGCKSKEFAFSLAIEGTWRKEGNTIYFDFYDEIEEIPINLFKN